MSSVLKIACVFTLLAGTGAAFAEGDAKKGEVVFNKNCKICHQVGPTAKPGVGPAQNGVVDSKAGSRTGYTYSKAMTDAGAGGLVWSEDNLNKYLENPKGLVPGTKMVFAGLKNPEDRADVIAYLKTFK